MDQPVAQRVRLVATTREIAPLDFVLEYADARHPLFWMRRGEGIAGYGVALRLDEAAGSGRIARLAARWRDVAASVAVDDPVGLAATGLVAFGAFAFDDRSDALSSLVVPQVVVGQRDGRSWITLIHAELGPDAVARDLGEYWSATLGPGILGPKGYQEAVRAGLDAVADGRIAKVVLARDLIGTVPEDADLRRLARALASGYPDCWTFAVDGVIGASPETLVTVSRGTVTARVLAGTAPRGADADEDTARALSLATSPKDQDEHLYAARSVVAALRPHTRALAASDQPFTLKLPNVWHLATDIEAELADAASALDLVGALHPTAAVAGAPTEAALEVIRELEPFDRGRYAGPVGWIDGAGDGEWAIALRCAQFGPGGTVTAHAGAGIVAGSDPEAELLETRVKFRPIVDSLA